MDDARWLDHRAAKMSRVLGVEFDDARQTIAMYRAMGQVHQYAYLHAWRDMRKEARWNQSRRQLRVPGEPTDNDEIDDMLQLLQPRDRYICHCWLHGWSLREIAKQLNLSKQHVSMLKRRAVARLLVEQEMD